jgi:hypothetical protein
MSSTLVILAAGAGTRYGGLKQLVPVGPSDETLLEYAAFDALRAGFDRIVLVVRQETEATFRKRLDSGMARHVPVTYVHQCVADLPAGFVRPAERVKPWGTGQAVFAAGSEIDGPFAVVNADDFYGAESYAVLSQFLTETRESGDSMAALGFHVAETLTDAGPVSRALLEVDDSGCLRKLVELLEVWREDERILYRDVLGQTHVLRGDELVSMNMWGLERQVLPELEHRFSEFLTRFGGTTDVEFILPEVIQSMVCDGRARVRVLSGSGEWCGITFSEDRPRVECIISSLVDQGRYPTDLWA